MKIKVLILLSFIFLLLAAFLFFKNRSYQQEMEMENQRIELVTDSLRYYKYMSRGDSLLIAEDYEGAMEYFRMAGNVFGQQELVQNMQNMAQGVKSRSDHFGRLRSRVVGLQNNLAAAKDSLEAELLLRDSLLKVSLSEIRLHSYRNELLRDSLSQAQAAWQSLKSKAASVGKAEFDATTGVKIYYAGDLVGGKAQGFGYGLFASGGIYAGEWKANKRHGEGKYIWKDGNVYIGDYKDDKREGSGTYYFTSGEKYVGEWKDNKRSGKGTLYGEEGQVVISGQWKNDQIATVEKGAGAQ